MDGGQLCPSLTVLFCMTLSDTYDLSHRHPILFFDGVCHLCDGFVQCVLRYDKEEKVRYCALQSSVGQEMMARLDLGKDISTAIGLYQGKIYDRSDVLKLLSLQLGGPWSLLLPLYIIPKVIRDAVYDVIARHRYSWFGKRDTCMIPDARHSHKFVC